MEQSAIKTHLVNDGILAYPTETLWGLGALMSSEKANNEIFNIKGRPNDKPISVLVANSHMARDLSLINDETLHFLSLVWPGPVTVVLPAKKNVPSWITKDTGFIGMRNTSHINLRKLLVKLYEPITTTSLNKSSEPPATEYEHTTWLPEEVLNLEYLGDSLDLLYDLPKRKKRDEELKAQGKELSKGSLKSKGSSIVKITKDSKATILREGDFPVEKLKIYIEKSNLLLQS